MYAADRGREASSDLSVTSLPFPASNWGQRRPCLPVVPSVIGKLRRGELGRGRNGAPNYKVTRENQSLLELSWYWRHRAHQTVDQWVSLGRRRKEEGSRAGYCTKESVPRRVQITPKVVWGFCYLFRCFSLNVHLLVLAARPCHTYQGFGFGTSITDYSETELSCSFVRLKSST